MTRIELMSEGAKPVALMMPAGVEDGLHSQRS